MHTTGWHCWRTGHCASLLRPAVCSHLADREPYIRDVSIYWMFQSFSIYFLDSQNWKNMAEPYIRDVSVYFLPNLTVDLPFLRMLIFHSYGSLPDGIWLSTYSPGIKHGWKIHLNWWSWRDNCPDWFRRVLRSNASELCEHLLHITAGQTACDWTYLDMLAGGFG